MRAPTRRATLGIGSLRGTAPQVEEQAGEGVEDEVEAEAEAEALFELVKAAR